MATQLFSNNAASTLAAGISATAASLTLATGDGAKFPAPSGGDYFIATLFQLSGTAEINIEIVKCTARTGDVIAIVRGQEGTTARAFNTGDSIQLRVTAGVQWPISATPGAQPASPDLTAIAGLTSAVDTLPYATGPRTWALTALTGFARTLIGRATAALVRGDLGAAAWSDVDAAASKVAPVDADELPIADSAAGFGLKKLTWGNMKAALLAYFSGTFMTTWTSAQTVYVATTGNDSTGTGAVGAPFLTIQKAINFLNARNLGGYNHVILVADGTYAGGFNATQQNGVGSITISGNTTTPGNCVISLASGQSVFVAGYSTYGIQGFKFSGASTIAIWLSGVATTLNHGFNEFALAGAGATHFYISGTGCSAQCVGNYTISQSAYAHIYATLGNGNRFEVWNKTITFNNSPVWGAAFVCCANANYVHVFTNCSFIGTATGPRYYCSANGIISTDGAGASFLPGSTAGSTATGGQYV